MIHSASLYKLTVNEVHQRTKRALGNIDAAGTSLADFLLDALPDYVVTSDDGERTLLCTSVDARPEGVMANFLGGQSGVVADIMDTAGQMQFHQESSHTQLVAYSGLFRLVPAQENGWLALQVTNGRGVKTLLYRGLVDLFRERFPDLRIHVEPFVEAGVLRRAVEENRVSKIKLVRYVRPSDLASASPDNWIDAGSGGKIELDISRVTGGRLRRTLLSRFYSGDENALSDILVYGGLEFDQAKIEVSLQGKKRTYNLTNPNQGFPITIDLDDLEFDDDDLPKADSLVAALSDLLNSYAP